eukprot:6327650-Prymnesium_polylepis.1
MAPSSSPLILAAWPSPPRRSAGWSRFGRAGTCQPDTNMDRRQVVRCAPECHGAHPKGAVGRSA